MRGDRALRLTGLYIWAGQLILLLILVIFGLPERSLLPIHIPLFCVGLIALFAFNYQYWFRRKVDVKDWLHFVNNSTLEDVTKYINSLDTSDQMIVDYATQQYWGHSCGETATYCKGVLHRIYGFHCGRPRKVRPGDILLLRTDRAGEVGRFIILDIQYMMAPRDQFFAYVAGIGTQSK